MLNFSPDRTNTRDLETNQLAIERHVGFDHYVRDFTPGAFVLGGAGAPVHVLVTAATPRRPAIAMVDAATSLAAVSFFKPSEWRTGPLQIRYWYTSPVGAVTNFAIQILAAAVRDGEVIPGTLLVDNTTAVPGPAVANTVIRSAYVYTTTSLGSDDEVFTVRIARLGADATDTNVNEFHFLHMEVEHIPAQQVSQ